MIKKMDVLQMLLLDTDEDFEILKEKLLPVMLVER
jgi:hypothetical protein